MNVGPLTTSAVPTPCTTDRARAVPAAGAVTWGGGRVDGQGHHAEGRRAGAYYVEALPNYYLDSGSYPASGRAGAPRC